MSGLGLRAGAGVLVLLGLAIARLPLAADPVFQPELEDRRTRTSRGRGGTGSSGQWRP